MTFGCNAFQISGWQTDCDPVVVVPDEIPAGIGKPRRNYYEIRGKLYFLSNDELWYLVQQLLTEDKPKPRKAKKGAIRIHVPKEWTPVPWPDIDMGVWDDLVVEAQTKNYPYLLEVLQRYNEEEDLTILLLYG